MYHVTHEDELLEIIAEGTNRSRRCCGRFLVLSVLGDLFCTVCGHAPSSSSIDMTCWTCGAFGTSSAGHCDECGEFIGLALDNLSIGGWAL